MSELAELLVKDAEAWHAWLECHHGEHPGVWLVMGKKGGHTTALTYPQALDEALCFGWVDGQIARCDDESYRRRFTPRRPGSPWSARNVEHVARLSETGRMQPGGIAAVDAAKAQGRWQAAYRGQSDMQAPPDLVQALAANPAAAATFDQLDAANRYSIAYRAQHRQAPDDPGPQASRVPRHARSRRAPPSPRAPQGPPVTFPVPPNDGVSA